MAQKTLLCVEPDEATFDAIREALEPYGFSATNIVNGEQAIDWARKNQPDLIIVSVEPRKVGYAICNKLRRSDELRDAPVILTSSEETTQTFEQHKKLKSRANEYLIKPFSSHELVAKVDNIIPLGEPSSRGEDLVVDEEISIADSDIVEEKTHGLGFGSARSSGNGANDLDDMFDRETDAAFAALQASDSENTGPITAETLSSSAASPPFALGDMWRAPAPWEPEATQAHQEDAAYNGSANAGPGATASGATYIGGAPTPVPDAWHNSGADDEPLGAVPFSFDDAPPAPESLADEAPPAPEAAVIDYMASARMEPAGPRPEDLARIAELEARLRNAESDRERLSSENEELKVRRETQAVFSKDKEVLTLREIINKKDKDILDLRDALDAKERQILDHKDRIREHERARRDLEEKSLGIEKQLMSASERIAGLVQDKDKGNDRERVLKAKLDDAHVEIAKAHDEIEALKKRMVAQDDKWRGDIERTRTELETRIAELEEAHRTEIARMTEEHTASEQGLRRDQEAELNRLVAAHALEVETSNRKAAEELAATIDRLQGEMAKLRREHEKAMASLKEEQAVQLAAERQAHQASSDAKERDHRNEILGMRRRQEEELRALDERKQRELADAEARRMTDLESAENRRRSELQARDEDHHALVAEMDRRHFSEKTEMSERHRSELDLAHARAARAEGELAARTEELSAAHRRIAGLEADLDSSRADLREREVKLAQNSARIGDLETRTTEYEEQIVRAFQKMRSDDKAIEKAKRALAVALSLLDDRGAPVSAVTGGSQSGPIKTAPAAVEGTGSTT